MIVQLLNIWKLKDFYWQTWTCMQVRSGNMCVIITVELCVTCFVIITVELCVTCCVIITIEFCVTCSVIVTVEFCVTCFVVVTLELCQEVTDQQMPHVAPIIFP